MQTSISPVQVYPATANTLMIRSITLGPPPSYYYELQDVQTVVKSREVPNPDYVPESVDADGNAVPAKGEPTMLEPYTEQVVSVLKNGNVSMTLDQWNAWPADADDDKVQLDAIALNLGLVRV
jgi:hypothetical protein